jgi:hypothetical protein
MDERKHDDEHRDESEALEDMDVPERESEDVKGGNQPVRTYSIKQAWPSKYTGTG